MLSYPYGFNILNEFWKDNVGVLAGSNFHAIR